MGGGHEDLLAVEPPPVTLGGRGGGGHGRNDVLPGFEERRGEDRRAVGHARKNSLLLLGRPEPRDGQRAEHQRRQQRQRRDRAALLLEDEAGLHEAVPTAADRFGKAHAEQIGLGELVPDIVGEPAAGGVGLDVAQPLRRQLLGEDAAGEVGDRLLIFGE